MKFIQTFCVVDSSLRILWVGGDWDEFALRAGGERAVANQVLSTELTAHITDNLTAEKVRAMVKTVIDVQRPLRLEYRCDSPDEVRRFRLTIQPMKDQRALMVHDLRDALRLETPMVKWSFDPSVREVKCSMCSKIHLPSGWSDPSDLSFPHPALVRYGLCQNCVSRVDLAIGATIAGDTDEDIPAVVPKSGIMLE